MKRLNIAVFLSVAALGLAGSADAQTLYTCGEGIVRSIQTSAETIVRAPALVKPDPHGEPQLVVDLPREETRHVYLVTVELFKVLYTGRASSDQSWNLDPAQLPRNEVISMCANGEQIVLDRQDGTDFRARVVRVRYLALAHGTQ